MAKRRVECLNCQNVLYVEQGVSATWLTCPRCLHQVMNPWQQLTTTPAPVPAPPASPRCPDCGRDVEAHWRFCPHCNEALRGGKKRRTVGEEVDVEVKRDAQGSAFSLGVFSVLAVGGLVLFLSCGGVQAFSNSPNRAGPYLVMGGVVALLLAGGFALMAGPRSPEQKILSGVLGGFTIALTLFVAFLFASCASFTFTCGGLLQPKK